MSDLDINMDIDNPYQSPETQIVPETSQTTGPVLTDTMLQYLYGASPWLKFIGILGFIGAGMMFFLGLIMTIGMSALSGLLRGVEVFGNVPFWIVGLIYIPMGLLLFFPARFTFRFGDKIQKFRSSNSSKDMEEAFMNNKSLWKFRGILYIVYLAFIPAVSILSMIVGIVAALRASF